MRRRRRLRFHIIDNEGSRSHHMKTIPQKKLSRRRRSETMSRARTMRPEEEVEDGGDNRNHLFPCQRTHSMLDEENVLDLEWNPWSRERKSPRFQFKSRLVYLSLVLLLRLPLVGRPPPLKKGPIFYVPVYPNELLSTHRMTFISLPTRQDTTT